VVWVCLGKVQLGLVLFVNGWAGCVCLQREGCGSK